MIERHLEEEDGEAVRVVVLRQNDSHAAVQEPKFVGNTLRHPLPPLSHVSHLFGMQYAVSFYRVEVDEVMPIDTMEIDESDLEACKRDAREIFVASGVGMAASDQPNAMTISDDLGAKVFEIHLQPTC